MTTYSSTEASEAMFHALSVISKDAAIRKYLAENDPKVLIQVEEARIEFMSIQNLTWRKEQDSTTANLDALKSRL